MSYFYQVEGRPAQAEGPVGRGPGGQQRKQRRARGGRGIGPKVPDGRGRGL
ncbi:hypothetical protein GCM10007977_028590 [Dactylosporangium sucinum]|uniref:Uncharacterized protein n=1 Tax=Dactylosporangium sucinum TaxID=1424081 RepID=A0A917TJG4_9ACTN|nr:hypothetical protein GCM10007977_028590 [Dactylosporangium sucinum]